jgi:thiol-disulfide isomerase/thioredoxin
MAERAAFSPWLDVAAGVAAIVAVVGSSMGSHHIGSDFRGIFSLTAAAFFLAGFARGGVSTGSLAWKTVRLSVGGFLGTAALIMNDGLHRLPILVGLALMALAVAAAGVTARKHWHSDRALSIRVIATSAVLAALIIILLVPRVSRASAYDTGNRPSPPFELVAGGRTIGPAELRGQVAVLAFWTSWCLPCGRELPELQQVYGRFRSDPRVAFLAVDIGWGEETAEAGSRYLAGHHLEIPMAFDRGDAAQALGVDGLPTLVILDQRSRVRLVHHGFDVSEDLPGVLTDKIEELLDQGGR